MSESDQLQLWSMENNAVWRAGFAHGALYPSMVFHLRGEKLGAEEASALVNDLIAAVAIPGLAEVWAASPHPAEDAPGFETIVSLLLVAVNHIQQLAGLPVFEGGRILKLEGENAQVLVTTSAGPYQLLANVMHWLVTCCDILRSGKPIEQHKRFLPGILNQIQSSFSYHAVAHQFIGCANRLGIPFAQLPDRVIEYGQGHLARRMLDTVTDATPNLSVHLSRQKRYAAVVMREAGIPVPEHHQVENVQQALHAASRLGYPVVVKPADRDGGEAVSADLHTPEEVQQGYAKAAAASKLVLVEKHVPGRDYRITVFQGQAVWAIERVPGGVYGDGKASVRELVDRLNSDPRRRQLGLLKPLVIDAEAHTLLRRAGLTEQSIPPAGQFLRLRGAANVASGGVPVAVFDQLHPDNAQLAVRAARALGADIAGIDLLIPDISCSWLESGAYVCEVNPGPDIGQTTAAHLFEPILTSLLQGNGRIPIVLVVGAEAGSLVDRLGDDGLDATGMVIGYSDGQGVRIRDEWLARKPASNYVAGQTLTRDRRVEAIVMRLDSDDLIATGLPFPRIDVLVVAGNAVAQAGPASGDGSRQAMEELVASLLPACDGSVVILPEAELALDVAKTAPAADLRTDISQEGLADFLCGQIRSIAAMHRAPKSNVSSILVSHD